MKQVAHYRLNEQELRGQVEALQAQVAAMGKNVANLRVMNANLQSELSSVVEALGQSTEARGKQADTIARLERENADLRRQVEALQGARRVALMLTDRDPWGDGCGYDVGQLAVMELRVTP